MEDFPTRLADLLEGVASKVRAMTVERAERAIRIASLALPLAVLGTIALVYLFMTIHAALAIPLGTAGALAVVGGLFLLVGAFLWRKRRPAAERES